MNNFLEKFDRTLIFFVIYTISFFVFFSTIGYTAPFFLAFLFSFFLRKPTIYLIKKRKLKSSLSAFITTTVFCIIIIGVILVAILYLISEMKSLTLNIQYIITSNLDYIYKWFNNLVDSYNKLDPAILDTINKNLTSQSSKISTYAVSISSNIATYLFNIISSLPYLLTFIIFTIFSTYFMTKDLVNKGFLTNYKKKESSATVMLLLENTKEKLGKYVLSYAFLIFMTFIQNLIGFTIFGVNYAFLLALLCGILDLLPVVGMIFVYGPLIITYIFQGNIVMIIGLICLYVFIMLVRQILEPRLLSTTLKIHPVASLAAIFIGLKAYGFVGMFYGIMLIVFYNILKEMEII